MADEEVDGIMEKLGISGLRDVRIGNTGYGAGGGNRGISGGEMRRVSIGLELIARPDVLILDEPTSSLDARAEYEVFQRFVDLTKGRTSVLISHRFSTVRMADRILVLNKGELLEIGSHKELLQKNGKYAELFQLQAKGYQ